MPKQKLALPGAQVVTPNWDGTPITLAVNDQVQIPNAPQGPAVMGWQNVATLNTDGNLTVTWGGQYKSLDAPVANKPSVWVYNWANNNITITNTSDNPQTPVWVELYGPGLGPTPQTLTVNTALPLPQGTSNTAQGTAPSGWCRIKLTATAGNPSVIAIIGAPDNNVYVYGLAWSSPTPPPGYTNVTQNNSMTLGPYSLDSATLFVANMSSGNAGAVTVLVQSF